MSDKVDAEIRRTYQAAFRNLPRLQREVFRLHRLEYLSLAEIASLIRISERSVERQLAKAILKIAKQLDGKKLSWWDRWW